MKIPVFFRPEMDAPGNVSYSPSAGKPAAVVADWLATPAIRDNIEIVAFNPVDAQTIAQAHDPAYVAGVLACEVANGFRNRSKEVADSLLYTVGSIVAAAKHVLREGRPEDEGNVAVSPTSGFHHAHYGHGYGYCTFNGLVVAAMQLKRLGLAQSVAIFDYDYHYGDGTDDIIQRLGLGFIRHFSAGSEYKTRDDAPRLMQELTRRFARTITASSDSKVDVMLYQAGADQHKDDPLGGVLSDKEMAERDYQVFRCARLYGVPLVWNLAGGYRHDRAGKTIAPVIRTHRDTVKQCVRVMVDRDC